MLNIFLEYSGWILFVLGYFIVPKFFSGYAKSTSERKFLPIAGIIPGVLILILAYFTRPENLPATLTSSSSITSGKQWAELECGVVQGYKMIKQKEQVKIQFDSGKVSAFEHSPEQEKLQTGRKICIRAIQNSETSIGQGYIQKMDS